MILHPRSGDLRRMLLLGLTLGLLLGLLETLQQIAWLSVRDAPLALRNSLIYSLVPWLLVLPFMPLVILLAERWPLDRGRWSAHLPRHLGASFALLLLHQALALFVLVRLDPSPSTSLSAFYLKLITLRMPVDMLVYWSLVGGLHALRAGREARERQETAARLEASLSEARLTALREQLQPHFLFNSLNAVSTLALRGDGQGVTRALSTLSELLRMALDTRAQELPLVEEMVFVDRYLELQQLRFGDRLTIFRRIDDEVLGAAVPAMLIQPLVENALRHGLERQPGAGRVEIHAHRDGDTLAIVVRDSGPGFRGRGALREGIGLGNTRARLDALYGDRATLTCGDAPEGGGEIRVTLPWRPLGIATPAPVMAGTP